MMIRRKGSKRISLQGVMLSIPMPFLLASIFWNKHELLE